MEKAYEETGSLEALKEIQMIGKMAPATPTYTFTDETELPWAKDILLIPTPGHTPGHCSVYIRQNRTLVSGDALVNMNGVLYGSNPIYTHDLTAATQSALRLAKLCTETVICAHGGVFHGKISECGVQFFS